MGSILGAGYGAAEGLDTMLSRLLLEKQVAETHRKNVAEEGLKTRQQDLADKLRRDTLAEKQSVDQDRQNAQIEKTVSQRGIGDTVSESEYAKESKAGVPSGVYDVKPGAKVASTLGVMPLIQAASSMHPQAGDNTPAPKSQASTTTDETSSMNAPRTINFRGTGSQRLAADREKRANTALDAKSEVDQQKLLDAADKLEMQGKLNEANILRAHAQAALDTAKTAHAGDARPLPQSITENMAGLNTAEVEGVKILKSLREGKLDQSNDPLDPRWNKFMVTTLKMAPGDWAKADIQQRTAAVNAMLTRGLMGARPSQYVAQIIQQHLPQGEMTGQQLAHVLHNVLGQAGERRTETESLTGREAGSLSPKSGMTYRQFLEGTSDTGVPTVGGTFQGGKVLKVTPVK